MKKRIFSVLAIMCSMMFIMTGCGGASDTDVNDGGINAEDNTMKFSELFQKDVIAYFGTLKDDEIVGKDQKIKELYFFHSDSSVTGYYLGYSSCSYTNKVGFPTIVNGTPTLGELAKMKNNQIEQSLVYAGNLSDEEYYMYQAQEGEISYSYKDVKTYSLGLVTDETGNSVNYEGFIIGDRNETWGKVYYGGHIQVYGSSYMLFQGETVKDTTHGGYSTSIMLIRDTKETKEKEIVFDDIGTEGIYIDGELGVTQDYDDSVTEG